MDPLGFLRSQLCVKLPVPTKSYREQTIIVTGSNVGIGLEVARHFVRLDASKVILAVRNKTKGAAAAKFIEESTGIVGVVEIWDLDLSSYASVKAFGERALNLDRLDILVNNAGIVVYDFEMAEDNESSITVNAISGLLLSILLLPKLRETSVRFKTEAVVAFTGSFVHFMTEFPEQKNENILKQLAVQDKARMKDRYYVSKLVQLLMVRELADQITHSSKAGNLTVNIANPGFVATEVMRNASATFHFFFKPYKALVSRSAEEGARTMLHAAAGGEDTHGQYLSDCEVTPPSQFVRSAEGQGIQKKIWSELTDVLESISPGIVKNI